MNSFGKDTSSEASPYKYRQTTLATTARATSLNPVGWKGEFNMCQNKSNSCEWSINQQTFDGYSKIITELVARLKTSLSGIVKAVSCVHVCILSLRKWGLPTLYFESTKHITMKTEIYDKRNGNSLASASLIRRPTHDHSWTGEPRGSLLHLQSSM